MTWAAVGLFFKAIPLRVYAILAVVLITLAVAWVLVDGYGDRRAAEVQAKWDASEARHAAQAARQAHEARKTEERHRADYAAAVDRLRAKQKEADENHAALVAGLRAGSIRLRERFSCPRLPGAPADPLGTDGAGPRGFGPEDAEIAFGIAAEADAVARRLNALQEAVRAGQR